MVKQLITLGGEYGQRSRYLSQAKREVTGSLPVFSTKCYELLNHELSLIWLGRTVWSGYGIVGMMCLPLMIYQLNFAPSYHLIPVHFLHSAIMAGYYSMHLFPVSASPISLHRCHCICILSYGFVGLSVRR